MLCVKCFFSLHLFFGLESVKCVLSLGWRLCSLRDLHHPALHTPQLVWNLLQVTGVIDFIDLLSVIDTELCSVCKPV